MCVCVCVHTCYCSHQYKCLEVTTVGQGLLQVVIAFGVVCAVLSVQSKILQSEREREREREIERERERRE